MICVDCRSMLYVCQCERYDMPELEFQIGYEKYKSAIEDFLPIGDGDCTNCDTCENPCKQLQVADCG